MKTWSEGSAPAAWPDQDPVSISGVEHTLADLGHVRPHHAHLGGEVHDDPVAVALGEHLGCGGRGAEQVGKVEFFAVDLHPAGVDLREFQDVVDDAEQMTG
jgi:hypothetical protein